MFYAVAADCAMGWLDKIYFAGKIVVQSDVTNTKLLSKILLLHSGGWRV
jgi:hypothetical protein